jgi:hypothetical protein
VFKVKLLGVCTLCLCKPSFVACLVNMINMGMFVKLVPLNFVSWYIF